MGMVALAVTTVGLAVPMNSVDAAEQKVTVEKQIIQGLPRMYSTNEFVIAHESGNPNNTGANALNNEIAYMSRNWQNAFVSHWVGGNGRVVQLAPTGYAQWGAGAGANYRSYAQVELARTNNKAQFQNDYKAYVTLLRQLAREAGIPLQLDKAGRGIKTHEWVTDNLGGSDHRDPYAYLNSMGISRSQFAKDIANGFQNGNSKPANPKPNIPSNSKNFKAGQTVKVTDALYRDSYGTGRSTAKRGQVGKIKRTDGAKKKYLVENWGWAHANDITVSNAVSVPNSNTGKKPVPVKGSNLPNSGYYRVNYATFIRSGAGTGYTSVGMYNAGQGFYYDSKYTAGGYTWLSYISYSGVRRYVAVV